MWFRELRRAITKVLKQPTKLLVELITTAVGLELAKLLLQLKQCRVT